MRYRSALLLLALCGISILLSACQSTAAPIGAAQQSVFAAAAGAEAGIVATQRAAGRALDGTVAVALDPVGAMSGGVARPNRSLSPGLRMPRAPRAPRSINAVRQSNAMRGGIPEQRLNYGARVSRPSQALYGGGASRPYGATTGRSLFFNGSTPAPTLPLTGRNRGRTPAPALGITPGRSIRQSAGTAIYDPVTGAWTYR